MISFRLRNCLKQVSDIRANSQYGGKLPNRMLSKGILFNKACKAFKRRKKYLDVSLQVLRVSKH